MVALPLIYQQFRAAGRVPDGAAAHDLLETVKVYNPVPPESEASYREAILCEYAAYCEQEAQQ